MDVVDNVVVPTAERNAGRALEPKHMSLVTWSWFFLLIWIRYPRARCHEQGERSQ